MQIIYHESKSFQNVVEWPEGPHGVSTAWGNIDVMVAEGVIFSPNRTRYLIRFVICEDMDSDPSLQEEILLPEFTRREEAVRRAIALFDQHHEELGMPHADFEQHPAYRPAPLTS